MPLGTKRPRCPTQEALIRTSSATSSHEFRWPGEVFGEGSVEVVSPHSQTNPAPQQEHQMDYHGNRILNASQPLPGAQSDGVALPH